MNKNFKIFGIIGGVILILILLLNQTSSNKFGSATSGLEATQATTSVYTVGTTAAIVFATSSTCSSRVITTVAKPIMITMSDRLGQTPTALFGHLQAASTTVVYDGGLYGCNAWKIYGFDAVSTITVSEFR